MEVEGWESIVHRYYAPQRSLASGITDRKVWERLKQRMLTINGVIICRYFEWIMMTVRIDSTGKSYESHKKRSGKGQSTARTVILLNRTWSPHKSRWELFTTDRETRTESEQLYMVTHHLGVKLHKTAIFEATGEMDQSNQTWKL